MKTNIIPNFNDLRLLISKSEPNTNGINEAIEDYEKFFNLIKKYPSIPLVPTKAIDKIWHIHLENSELYKKDSLKTVGYLVGHKKATTAKEKRENRRKYNLTCKLWGLTYHSDFGNYSDMAFCGVDGDDGDDGGYDGSINDD